MVVEGASNSVPSVVVEPLVARRAERVMRGISRVYLDGFFFNNQ